MSLDGDGSSAKWNCFRASCGFSGGTARKDTNSNGLVPLSTRKKKQAHQPIVRPQVELQPLTEEMVAFFASRGISKETLERNKVRVANLNRTPKCHHDHGHHCRRQTRPLTPKISKRVNT